MSNDIQDYYLVLSRLMRTSESIWRSKPASEWNRRLIIIGDGPDRARLEKLGMIESSSSDDRPDQIVNYYARVCRAAVVPGEEDFGMAPLEANAAAAR